MNLKITQICQSFGNLAFIIESGVWDDIIRWKSSFFQVLLAVK